MPYASAKNIEIERNNLLFARQRILDGITNNQVICANGCRNAVESTAHVSNAERGVCVCVFFFLNPRRLCNFKRNNKLFGRSAVANAIKWNFTHFFFVSCLCTRVRACVCVCLMLRELDGG